MCFMSLNLQVQRQVGLAGGRELLLRQGIVWVRHGTD